MSECEECGGSGYLPNPFRECPRCGVTPEMGENPFPDDEVMNLAAKLLVKANPYLRCFISGYVVASIGKELSRKRVEGFGIAMYRRSDEEKVGFRVVCTLKDGSSVPGSLEISVRADKLQEFFSVPPETLCGAFIPLSEDMVGNVKQALSVRPPVVATSQVNPNNS